MDDQNKNLILASALSFLVIIIWFVLFPPPEAPLQPETPALSQQADATDLTLPAGDEPVLNSSPTEVTTTETAPRIAIETDRLNGSISLKGGRIDDLELLDYRVELDKDAPEVTLLIPEGRADAHYAGFGWVPISGLNFEDVPNPNTIWSILDNNILTHSEDVTLVWHNQKGLVFERTISIDENFMFTITQRVENSTDKEIALHPYGLLKRHGLPQDLKNFFILHEGLVRMSDGELEEASYMGSCFFKSQCTMEDFKFDERDRGNSKRVKVLENGWTGFTDHFWMTALIPEAGKPFRSNGIYYENDQIFETNVLLPKEILAPGKATEIQTQFFAGAKEWDIIRAYEKAGVDGFLDSIDWGWFFFLTKPIFAVLHWLNALIGNMGWAIIGLTLLIKALLFPLAYKSYVSMAKMKELQPQMEKIKEAAGDDRQKLQQEMMALYKKEKVNPASGCLPILLQIPIFVSLYKVIFVTLDMRHAPWIGWIKDLSAPDPSSIMNLFGLLPFSPPDPTSALSLIFIGILPILLGVSMWIQQKLNPAPTDPTQAMIFAWLPWVFMFMLGTFASGLVIYWIANNTITFTQQYLIMRSQGYKPDVFGNVVASFKKKSKTGRK
jgi:YidC/Oxa1 family membrane protein insertase